MTQHKIQCKVLTSVCVLCRTLLHSVVLYEMIICCRLSAGCRTLLPSGGQKVNFKAETCFEHAGDLQDGLRPALTRTSTRGENTDLTRRSSSGTTARRLHLIRNQKEKHCRLCNFMLETTKRLKKTTGYSGYVVFL